MGQFAPVFAVLAKGAAGLKVAGAGAAKAAAAKGAGVVAAKSGIGSTIFQSALSLAPAAIAAGSRQKAPGVGRVLPAVDREAAEAADRERLRRAQEGRRSTILTGPGGAPGSALLGRTILSGG